MNDVVNRTISTSWLLRLLKQNVCASFLIHPVHAVAELLDWWIDLENIIVGSSFFQA